jgi:hypothetical protein
MGSLTQIVCKDCGDELIPTSSGGVCPHGHGKIIPGVTAALIRQYHRQRAEAAIRSLPAAVRKSPASKFWTCEGKTYRRNAGPACVHHPPQIQRPGEYFFRLAGRQRACWAWFEPVEKEAAVAEPSNTCPPPRNKRRMR